MAKYDKKAAINIIVRTAKEYEKKLNDKHFLIIYQEGKLIRNVTVGFRDMNFLHMTGVRTKQSAKQFYSACINARLSENDFDIDNDGKVQRKLQVLPYLPDLLYNKCMLGSFINSGVCIKAEYFVGNTKATLSVGFRNGKNVDFPVTLYNEDVRKLTNPTNKVLAVLRKNYNDDIFNEYTYLAKDQKISELITDRDTEQIVFYDDLEIVVE